MGIFSDTYKQNVDSTSGGMFKQAYSNKTNPAPTMLDKASDATQNLGVGIDKGIASTVVGLGTLTSQGLSKIPGPTQKFFQGGVQEGQQAQQALAPKGTAQQVGYTGEKVAEFFVPGTAEEKAYAKGVEQIAKVPKALNMIDKAGNATKAGQIMMDTMKVALKSGITGASTAGVTAAQGGSLNEVKKAGITGAIAGGIGQTIETFGKGLAQSLQKSGFKLSPAQEAKASAKVDQASKFMTDNKILGTDESKYNKLATLNDNLESTLQSSLPKDTAIPKQQVIDNINSTIESLKKTDPAIYKSAKRDADSAINLLKSNKGDTTTVEDALSSKRSYGKQAFKQTKFTVKDPNVVSEGNYAVEQGFQKALNDTLDKTNSKIQIPSSLQSYFGGAKEVTLPEFNKVYSDAITSKNLTNLARFKSDSGLVGRMFGLWAGESLGQSIAPGLPGKIIGGAVGEIASTKIPGMVRNASQRVLSADPSKIIGAAKIELGTTNSPQ